MSMPRIVNLPLWDSSTSLSKRFNEQFSPGEVLMAMKEQMMPGMVAKPQKSADLMLRETLHSLSALYEQHGAPLVVLMKYDDESMCVMFELVAVRKRENGEPILQVHWSKHKKTDADLDSVFAVISKAMRQKRLVPMTVERSEVELCAKVLEENQTTRREYTLPAPSKPYNHSSYFTLRYAPDMVDTRVTTKKQLKCVMCGKKGPKRCAKCASAQYCSVACQHAHWKAGHKEVCGRTAPNTQLTTTAPSSATGGDYSVLIDSQQEAKFGTTFSNITGISSHYRTGSIPHNVHGDSEFLVKVQIPMIAGGPMMMYDETKSFTRDVQMSEPGAREMYDAVDRYGAMKLYFRTKREGKFFRIFLRPLPSQVQPW